MLDSRMLGKLRILAAIGCAASLFVGGIVAISKGLRDRDNLGASLVANPGTIDLGRVRSEVHRIPLSIRNVSSEQIDIVGMDVGCTSCTTATLPSTRLLPGEELPVDVRWDVRGYNGATSSMIEFRYRDQTVRAADPENGGRFSSLAVVMVADVIAAINSQPTELQSQSWHRVDGCCAFPARRVAVVLHNLGQKRRLAVAVQREFGPTHRHV